MRSFRTMPAAFLAVGALVFSAPAPVRATSATPARTHAQHTLLRAVPEKTATGCVKTYEVRPNDSWNRIAKKVSVTMSLLLKVNKANTKTMLLIGDVICLPRAAVTESSARRGAVIGRPARLYTTRESAAIIREIFPDRLEDRALAIARRESSLNAANVNGSSCCLGLFQIHWFAHRSWLKNIGITTPEQLLDARLNAKAALALYKRSNSWSAWE